MRGFVAVYLRELLIIKHRLWRLLLSFAISPALYLVAFGLGIGREVQVSGRPYLEFLIPGLVAMSSMMQGFGINVEINVARFYLKIFEEFQAAPISPWGYVLGEVATGITRALMAVGIILLIALPAGIRLSLGPFFWLAVVLNATIFAALGVSSAMLIKSHADQALVTNFIITPMAFLGGTFFPVENMPALVQVVLKLLPLTHASYAIRQVALGEAAPIESYYILVGLVLVCLLLAFWSVDKARD
ncbi:ABC transporter permease [Thermosulfuriphilus sp.]